MKIRAIQTMPRVGFSEHANRAFDALKPFPIDYRWCYGYHWGHGMQGLLELCVRDGVDWALALDFDSLFTRSNVEGLLARFRDRTDIDALAPIQLRRGEKETPIFKTGKEGVVLDDEPVEVQSAHFGLTLIRIERLKDLPKPWFTSLPDENGSWGPGRTDDDTYFWNLWRAHGRNIFVEPCVGIGHLQQMVSVLDDDGNPQHLHMTEWWRENGIPTA